MKDITLKIPNLGEAEDTEIIEISVKVGDKIKKNDPIIVLESEKAAMEVPSDYEGVIKQIKVNAGDSVKEGSVFAVIEVDDKEKNIDSSDKITTSSEKKIQNTTKEPNKDYEIKTIDFSGINAGPAVRKIARELEIDLKRIIGSGKNGMITKDDLKNYIHSGSSISQTQYPDIKDLEIFGKYTISNQSKIRKAGAKNLTKAWQSIPHVSHFEEIDITKIEQQRSELNKISSVKITPLSYLVKSVSLALKQFPLLNSSLVDNGKLMLKKYINIGIAVNTDEGLVVPVIKDADSLKFGELASKILDLSNKARNKKLFKDDLIGGTFTISSLGSIGGTGFTPIINPPESAILGISRAKKELYFHDDRVQEKSILPITLSYDHRIINGVDAGNFMSYLKKLIEGGIS